MSVTAESEADDHGALEHPVPALARPVREGGSFLGPLVVRLSTEYGVDPEAIRRLGAEVLASFAGARVQAFVPILVEKQLRETLRGRSAPGTVPVAHEESAAVPVRPRPRPTPGEGPMALVPPHWVALSHPSRAVCRSSGEP